MATVTASIASHYNPEHEHKHAMHHIKLILIFPRDARDPYAAKSMKPPPTDTPPVPASSGDFVRKLGK